ncbi:Lysine histidine transporter 1 [Platanthera guangdongensis]|uniref:Lysine histidine transporter 1 n=1 Tax=Platanthera guangdongensis TaxID=2320717 RepID=A0ABR2LTB9_9ASPA
MGTVAPARETPSTTNKTNLPKSEKEKAIEEWLPITSSRNAKWWYSAFHNVTAMGPGIMVLILSWIITLYTLWQMVEMHEMVPGKRFDRYHELGQHAFGERLGLWIVVPQQLIVEIGVCIVYMVTGGKSLKKFHDTVCPDCKNIKVTYFIMIFASVHFVLSQLPNFNSISGVSLAAAVMSLSYSTIAWAHQSTRGNKKGWSMAINLTARPAPYSTSSVLWGTSPLLMRPQRSSGNSSHHSVYPGEAFQEADVEGRLIAYIVVALCYFPVALVGFWAFGNSVEDNILISLQKPRWLIATANMMVVIHVIGSYQIYAMPVFDMAETVLVKKLHFPPGIVLRLIARSTYVAITMFLGMTFPFFGGLLGFFGGFAFAPTTYFVNLHRVRSSADGLSPIGGLRQIILQAKTYKFYS